MQKNNTLALAAFFFSYCFCGRGERLQAGGLRAPSGCRPAVREVWACATGNRATRTRLVGAPPPADWSQPAAGGLTPNSVGPGPGIL